MQFITFIKNSDEIRDSRVKGLFLTKVKELERIVAFFEEKQVRATITIKGRVTKGQLHSHVSVYCEDEGYKKAIEECIRSSYL